jgi:hypothetical protein
MTEAAQKLFMVMVGGHTPTSNLEVHDMRFVTGEKIEDTHETLQSEWWGDPDTLHLDVWAKIACIDGYDIILRPEVYDGAEKLFFVNLGGYDPNHFDELHKNVLVVAKSEALAKHAAKETVKHWSVPHKDTSFEIEKIIPLSQVGDLHIHLEKSLNPVPFSFEWGYTPISKKALAKKAPR